MISSSSLSISSFVLKVCSVGVANVTTSSQELAALENTVSFISVEFAPKPYLVFVKKSLIHNAEFAEYAVVDVLGSKTFLPLM